MSLVDYDSSSTNSESDDADDDDVDCPKTENAKETIKDLQKAMPSNKSLPSAAQLLGANTNSKKRKSSEIFGNPFLEAERAKTAVLEKHVKMVVVKDVVDTMNGRKICWSNRKGRCRFGSSCQYAHVSDLIVEPKAPVKEEFEEYLIMPPPTLHSNSASAETNQDKLANFGNSGQPNKKALK